MKSNSSVRAALALALALAAGSAAAVAAAPAYLAASFSTDRLYFLDDAMQPLSSFAVADPLPNAVSATPYLLYAGYFLESSVVAYGYDGEEHFRWSAPGLDRLSGLAAVGPYLAAAADDTVYLLDAKSGRYVAQLSAGDSLEGLAYDGHDLWTLGSQLVARDFDTGRVVRSIPNAALACDFGGTGIAARGDGRLMLGCSDGRWFEVAAADGSVLRSGSNGLDMFDLAALPVPEPAAALLLALGLAALMARAAPARWSRGGLVPAIRLERMTYRLQGGCSTS